MAGVAEVEIDRQKGWVRVPHAFGVADAGQIINPDGLAKQTEGGMIQSTSWTLHEAVRFDRNSITSRDWSSYPILTMPEAPETFVTLIDHNQEKPLGAACATSRSVPSASRRHSVKDRCPAGLPGVFCPREQTREQRRIG